MKVADLRGILTYVPRYRDKVFVIALDGEVLAEDHFSNLLLDIAVLWSLGIRIVLVHGASFQIKKLASEKDIPISNADGTGPTSEATLDVALNASNRLTHEVMEALTSTDIRSIYSNAIIAHPAGILSGVDYLFTGKVEKVDDDLLKKVLSDSMVPVIPPLGFDGAGRTYRVNSDAIAFEVAKALNAAKLIYVSTNDKLTQDGTVVAQLSVVEAEEYQKTARLQVAPELRSKLEYAIKACRAGVSRVHLVNGKVDEALLGEVFLNEGTGTMIYANEYQSIRPAMKKDIRALQRLIQRGVASEELLKRSRAQILAQLADYWVFEVDRNIIACVALHEFPEQNAAELACLYVSSSHENAGIGRKLLAFAEKKAREKGFATLFALSTQTFAYFQQKAGFVEATASDLPPVRREKWEQSGRNSKVLVKRLT